MVWRKHLPVRIGDTRPSKKEIEGFFEAAPPHASELLETETWRIVDWLIRRATMLLSKRSKPADAEEAADTEAENPAEAGNSTRERMATRHGKRMTRNEALVADVRSEVLRRGIVTPTEIEVIELREGPRGGLAGRLRLHFATAVSGLILIGRTRHIGGGLFSAGR